MKKIRQYLFRKKLSTAIQELKGKNSFWEKWFLDVKNKTEIDVLRDIEKKQEEIILSIADKQAIDQLLEWRAVVYLKNMDYGSEWDTEVNRIRLYETTAIRQYIKSVYTKEENQQETINQIKE